MMQFRLYLMCHRVDALVASQLTPEEFGAYMSVGSMKQAHGKVLFFEIDPAKVGSAFDLGKARAECVQHPDGRPKRSKYISIYRTMERMPLEAFGPLYLTTRDGRVMKLDEKPINGEASQPGNGMYLELCPVVPLVVSRLAPAPFLREMTNPANAVSVPKLLIADLQIDQEADGQLASYLPYPDPAHIVNCLKEVSDPSKPKHSKTVDRTPKVEGFYRTLRRGFFLGDQSGVKYYPFPSRDELDEKHHLWWRSASMGA